MTTIGTIAETSLGKMLDAKRATGKHPTPYLRNINVRWGSFDLADIATMDIRPEELERVLATPGDVIVCEGGEPGRAAVWRGPGTIALQKALHRVRATQAIEPRYLAALLHHAALSRSLDPLFTGTTIRHLPQEKLRLVPVPLAPLPEQERIVAAIEEQFSRLDEAEQFVRSARRRLPMLRGAVLASAVAEGEPCTMGEVLTDIVAGKSFRTDGRPASEDEWGVVKVSAMTWGRFLDNENKAVPSETLIDPQFEIRPGDVLLSRANTVEYVGATVYVERCRPRLLLSDKSMRLLPHHGVDSRWLAHALNSPYLRRQMSLVATGTSDSMRNISQEKVKRLELRVPSMEEQRALADEIDRQLSLLGVLKSFA